MPSKAISPGYEAYFIEAPIGVVLRYEEEDEKICP
jgi:hypothetical protein